nr:SUMF1/EgtB/PvdO family nonheme iron enzyme [Flavilitoribacter sp.]
MRKYRYPGAQPFSTSQQDIFFGRDEDIQRLYQLISLENLVVLYGKSGLGKSSLLNAGILPKILAEGRFRPFQVRFGAYTEGQTSTPAFSTRGQIGLPEKPASYLDKLLPGDDSLWRHIKDRQAYGGENTGYLLLFDQFEELFTYPEEQVLTFKQELKELLNRQVPQRFREALEKQYTENALQLSEAELDWLHRPIELKVVAAIRSDRMSLLNQLKDYLPNILRHCYELDALTKEQAEDAILNPAYKKGKDFLAPPFDYENDALDAILDFLTRGHTRKIESFQLQILCQSIERRVIEETLPLVTRTDVGDFERIYKHYYGDQIALLGSPADQLAARKLIEEGLIFEEEERRLSLYEGQIHKSFGISPELLRKLVDSHLLRAEPSMQGGYTYELSHDTLVAPVLQAKAKRREEEQRLAELEAQRAREAELAALREKAEEERRRAEAEKQLREKAQNNEKRARQRTRLAVLISLIALLAALFALWSYNRSETARKRADENAALAAKKSKEAGEKEVEAKEALSRLQEQQAATEEQRKRAESNLLRAQQEEARARAALAQVEQEKNATEEQRQIAEINLSQAEQAREFAEEARKQAVREQMMAQEALKNLEKSNARVVRLILQNADKDILNLDYTAALEKIKAAADLGALEPEVAKAFLEMAFWYGETGRPDRAIGLLDSAALLAESREIPALVRKAAGEPDTVRQRDLLRLAMQTLNPGAYDSLFNWKYYPEMVRVEGGTFMMGSESGEEGEKPGHPATVNDFKLARTETTVWQFALYCAATGRDIRDFLVASWGEPGNNPIVNVSWEQAMDYANWVSRQKGKPEAVKETGGGYSIEINNEGYRLPTEAEWEYAARGGKHLSPFIYSGSDEIDEVAWYDDNSGSRTHPVGAKKANALGLYDMSGNAREWCWDWYGAYTENPPPDYTGPGNSDDGRVVRGGSWVNFDNFCRC